MLLSTWWAFNTALGNSEGLLAAARCGRSSPTSTAATAPRSASLAAALLRPEVWPFLGLYGLWLWRTGLSPAAGW